MAPENTGDPDGTGVLAVVGLGFALVLCCAIPVLVAASVLAAALRSGWLLLVAAGLLAGAAASAVRCRRRLWARHQTALRNSHGTLGILPTDGACGFSELCDRLEQPEEHHE